MRRILRLAAVALALCLFAPQSLRAADILLDEPVRLAQVICFPSRSDANKYYYVPLRARLATHPDGLPQFSFLRWVENVDSDPDAEERRTGVGGGIVHAVVKLGLTEQEVAEARAELVGRRPGAKLEGPVIFNSGTFALITSFQGENKELVRSLVGVGEAPVIEGAQAAISLELTQKGAEVLWESFHTATPDISFLFTLTLDGYRAPVEATLEADFEEIYKHESFRQDLRFAALAELGAAVPVDEIVEGIALTQGVPLPLPNLDVGVKARAGGYFQSEIDRSFDDLRTSGAIRIQYVGDDAVLQKAVNDAYTKLRDLIFQPAERLARAPDPTTRSVLSRGASDDVVKLATTAATAVAAQKPDAAKAPPPPEPAKSVAVDTKKQTGTPAPTGGNQRKPSDASAPPLKPKEGRCSGFDTGESKGLAQLSLAVEACLTLKYQFKDTKQTGKYRLDLRKYSVTTLRLPFAENIGDLRGQLENPAVFRSVNLDDPFYQQREISTALSGVQLADFGDVLSSVVVQLRKQHESGAETVDEVKIDRASFARNGGNARLLYGWKGDADRDAWLDYDYRVRWSFSGAPPLESDWHTAHFGFIDLTPPYQRRTVELAGDPEELRAKRVRSIAVRIYYGVGGTESAKQITLRPADGELSSRVEILSEGASEAYDYEITWRMTGNRSVSSGRLTTTDDLLYVDELPAGATVE